MLSGIPAIQSGLSAVRAGSDRLDAAAAAASTAFLPVEGRKDPPPFDLVGALVEMMLAKHQVAIGAHVIGRASDADRHLLDLLA
jgi:hypothetical protein